MHVRAAYEEYLLSIRNLAEKTQRWYVSRLEPFVDFCETFPVPDVIDIRPSHIQRFIEHRATFKNNRHEAVGGHTLHGYAQSVKTFMLWCSENDWCQEKVGKRVSMPQVDKRIIHTFTLRQIEQLYAACSKEYLSYLRARDIAVLSVLLDTGMRASELCNIKVEDLHMVPNDSYVKIFGKGRKEREVPLGKRAVKDIKDYLRVRPLEHHSLFLARKNSPLTLSGLDQMLYRLRDWAHLDTVEVRAHVFRHTFAVEAIKSGIGIYPLSRLMGHASVSTTEVYLRHFQAIDARQNVSSIADHVRR